MIAAVGTQVGSTPGAIGIQGSESYEVYDDWQFSPNLAPVYIIAICTA